jgi:iron complex outermembrane recepter protein
VELVRIVSRLCVGTSALALLAGVASAQSGSDTAAGQGPAMEEMETVTVTGTHISGSVSTGSKVHTLDQEDIQKTAPADAYSLLQELPQALNLGTNDSTNFGGSQRDASNQGLANIVDLRHFGRTLTLFNGQRVAGTGSGAAVQVDLLPTNMIQRLDVQADGGSAIYGSDAVTGTVNLLLRDPADVTQISGQDTFKRGNSSWDAGALLGRTWSLSGMGDGGIIVGYQHTYTGPTAARDLPWTFSDNLVPYEGAAGSYPTTSTPGNVSGFGPNTTALYPVPVTGIGSGGQLTLGQLGSSSSPNRTSVYEKLNDVLPKLRQDSLAFNVKQELTPWLRAFAFGYFYRRQGFADYGTTPQPVSTFSVPNTNPYSPCATAAAAASAGLPPPDPTNSQGLTCPANGTINASYDFVNELGPALRLLNDKSFMETAGFDVDLPYEWSGRVSESMSYDVLLSRETTKVNSTALNQVISGVGKPSSIPFFNPFCSDASGPCNSALTDAYITAYKAANDTNRLYDFEANFDGPLFDLPAGPLRMALGFEYQQQYALVSSVANTTNAVGLVVPSTFAREHRDSPAAYVEAYIPVISPNMGIPLVNELEFDAAMRFTSYTFPKVHTYNPKFGMTYLPYEDLTIRGTFGTSFLAPGLGDSDPFSSSNVVSSTSAYKCGMFTGINLSACPNGVNTSVNAFYVSGGNSQLQPEKGKSWTLGADWTPKDLLPGFTASVTYYKLLLTEQFVGLGSTNFPAGVANLGYLDQYVAFNPTYFPGRAVVTNFVKDLVPGLTLGAPLTQAQFNAAEAALFALPQYSAGVQPTLPVAFFSDNRVTNSGFTKTDGFDFNAEYYFETPIGTAHVGAMGTYVTSFLVQTVTGSTIYSRNNQFDFNARLKGRLEAGLTHGGFNGTLYLNYTNPYKSDPAYVPPAALALNPNYTNIAGNITWDLSAGYQTAEQFANYGADHMRLQVVIRNVLDKKPPFFLNAATSPSLLSDTSEASPLGRTITVSLAKDF